MRVRIVIAALLALMPACAMAEGSNAGFGMGGNYSRFDPVVAQYNASGELFRISGHCQSSCTLFLGIRNVCVVAVFTKDVAETKATRATDAGRAKGYPLLFTTEPEE